jgi:hypothetical protein
MNHNAILILTLGNRRVGGIEIPMDEIMTHHLVSQGLNKISQTERNILFKKMAYSNDKVNTMNKEKIIIMRKVT